MATLKKIGDETAEYLEEENLIKVTVPIRVFHSRGGRNTIEMPDGPLIEQHDMSKLKHALICGHRWLKMLEKGWFTTLEALAKKEKTDKSRVAKFIRLTCIAPDIQEAILCDTGTWVLTLKDCIKPFPMLWTEQRKHFRQLAIVSPKETVCPTEPPSSPSSSSC